MLIKYKFFAMIRLENILVLTNVILSAFTLVIY